MRWFTKSTRPVRPGSALRTRLRLEQLDYRAVPSSLTGDGADLPFISADVARTDTDGASAPVIISFTAAEVGHGLFRLSGQVQVNPSAAGLTVTFGGVPSLGGLSTVTASDGTFSLLVPVKTDGSDNGTATAQTTAYGQLSNTAMDYMSPTP